jgi:hypothetical protein
MESLINEIDDFDLEPATYAVMLLVHNKEGTCIGAHFFEDFEDPEKAISKAKERATELAALFKAKPPKWGGEEVWAAMVTVETVVDCEEASDAGTLFKDTIYNRF